MRVTPRAVKDEVTGVGPQGQLLVRVRAAAAEGAANAAMLHVLARALDVPQSTIVLERGATSRNKLVSVTGVDVEALRTRWPGVSCRPGA